MVGELSTTEVARHEDAQGYEENEQAVRSFRLQIIWNGRKWNKSSYLRVIWEKTMRQHLERMRCFSPTWWLQPSRGSKKPRNVVED